MSSKKGFLKVMSEMSGRLKLAMGLGQQYGGDRDVYQALGYPTSITFPEYKGRYFRQDVAKAIIDRPVRAAWRGGLTITTDKKENTLEKAWIELEKKFKINTKLSRLDKLSGIGEYGVLLMGINDVKKESDMKLPVKGRSNKLTYLKPLTQGSAEILSWEEDPSNERFGKPVLYNIKIENTKRGISKTLQVHYSRVIHIVEDVFEDEITGTPRLEAVYNRLMDLEKIVGGDAEMYWRGARPGYHAKVDKDFEMGETEQEGLEEQFDEFEHKMRRFLVNEGVDVTALEQQIADPSTHVAIQMKMISAVTGIPSRILTGSELGQLSSTQDREEWNLWVSSRREEYMEPSIVRPVIDAFMEYGILPNVPNYIILWDLLFAMSPKEKAEIAEKISNAIRYYTATPMAEYILPKEIFRRKHLGLTKEEMKEAEDLENALPDLEPVITEQEKTAIGADVKKDPMKGTGEDTVAKKQKA